MKLSWSTCARRRAWSKAIGRIRPTFDSLKSAFAAIELRHPIHEAILVGITDEHGKDYYQEVPNDDGYFQALVGFDPTIGLGAENDRRLQIAVFEQLSRVILACPFATPDRESVTIAIQSWAKANLASTE